MYLLLLYKLSLRFLRGHLIAHLWYLVDAYFRRSAYFVLCLPAEPFLGLVGEADYPLMVILLCPERLESAQLWCWLCLQGAFPTPCQFRKILRTPLYPRGSPFNFLCLVFSGGGPEVAGIFSNGSRASWIDLSSDFLRVLCSCHWMFPRELDHCPVQLSSCSSSSSSMGSWFSLVSLWWQELRSFWIVLLLNCNQCHRKSDQWLLCPSSREVEVLDGLLPLSMKVLFCRHIS